ncbi:VTT domain-containing protein [Oceanibacterium hippocampi]|uniref:Phospholipase D n=1 Tax=Oceanibacterium hippocampi TaxID=745714 RepID=A0A1Y5TQS3_9PROT|nr:VTT domain-containing protein [Oceanibacterium hippocampi]SLN69348.1 TVP38/TMEM64 family inner membrane protein YdjZ [Oceanibacterium hippocampi]
MAEEENGLLQEGSNCWRRVEAERAALLVDGDNYFPVLRRTLMTAEKSIFIIGWDVDSRCRLCIGEVADDDAPTTLGPLLNWIAVKKPELRVHVLLWDYSIVYAAERETLPTVSLDWATPANVRVCLDDSCPVGTSHHQKIVVVDDAIAFCGGLDLTIRRWDRRAHKADDSDRIDPSGAPYRAFHDMQMIVNGEAARALGELSRGRWRRATGRPAAALAKQTIAWPEGLEPDFRGALLGIARTEAEFEDHPEVREVEQLFIDTVMAAERTIYIENQFITARRVAEALARRMEERPELELVMVAPKLHHGWLEENSMNGGRQRFLRRLAEAGVADRVRLLYPAIPDDEIGEGVMVHAKCMIADDRFLRVGSANLANRSMGTDTECDLLVEARNEEDRAAIRRLRNGLIGEHCGRTPDEVEAGIDEAGSLLAWLDDGAESDRALRPIDLDIGTTSGLGIAVSELADPENPVDPGLHLGDSFNGQVKRPLKPWIRPALAGLLLLAVGLAWALTPLSEFARPAALKDWLAANAGGDMSALALLGIYLVGGLLAFPITVLIAVTAMLYDPLTSFVLALTGSLLTATVTYLVGWATGRGFLRGVVGRRVNQVSRALASRGVMSVTALRLMPIAPFTVVNLVAGASHIRFTDYLIGSILGLVPGILVITAFGHQLARLVEAPTISGLSLLALCVLAWLAVTLGLQRLVHRFGPRN